jgi:hypothetical protein
MGRGSMRQRKNINTKDAESHGVPRRFFGYRRGESNHAAESIAAFLIFDNSAALFLHGSIAQAADGPVAAWSSVVLGERRVKTRLFLFSTHAKVLCLPAPLAANDAFR